MGSEGTLGLDATRSYDPNDGGRFASFDFAWRCAAGPEQVPCRDAQGLELPLEISATSASPLTRQLCLGSGPGDGALAGGCARLAVTLEGTPEGLHYNITCFASKGHLSATVHVAAVVVRGYESPAVSIAALDPPRVNPDAAAVLRAAVLFTHQDDEHARHLLWSAHAEQDEASLELDLESVASTPLSQPSLGVQAGSLTPGGRFWFTLHAADTGGAAAATLLVQVNRPPWHDDAAGGAAVATWPSDALGGSLDSEVAARRWLPDGTVTGVALEEYFTAAMLGWEDDPEDLPLQYQVSYQLDASSRTRMLMDFSPLAELTFLLPERGLAENAQRVALVINIQDMMGAMSTISAEVHVTGEERAAVGSVYTDTLISRSAFYLANGNTEDSLAMLIGAAAILNGDANGAPEVQRLAQRRVQRADMAELLAEAADTQLLTDTSIHLFSDVLASVAAAPAEVGNRTSDVILSTLGGLVDATRAANGPVLDADTAMLMCHTLSNLTMVQEANDPRASQVAACVDVLDRIADTLARRMISGQVPTQVVSEQLAVSVQIDSAASPDSRLFHGAIVGATPSMAASEAPPKLWLPASMSAGLVAATAHGLVRAQLLTSLWDPHDPLGGAQGGTSLPGGAAPVTAITLADAATGRTLHVDHLEQGLHIALPLGKVAGGVSVGEGKEPHPARGIAPQCVWWDEAGGTYSTEGCAALPNPAPPEAGLFWEQTNTTMLGESSLARGWAIGNASQMRGCRAEYAGDPPELNGAEARRRKYLGADCQVPAVGNTLGCWWVWQRGVFEGPKCVHAASLKCLCSHLTDFTPKNMEVGGGEPGRMRFVSSEEMIGDRLHLLQGLLSSDQRSLNQVVLRVPEKEFEVDGRTTLWRHRSSKAFASGAQKLVGVQTWSLLEGGVYLGHVHGSSWRADESWEAEPAVREISMYRNSNTLRQLSHRIIHTDREDRCTVSLHPPNRKLQQADGKMVFVHGEMGTASLHRPGGSMRGRRRGPRQPSAAGGLLAHSNPKPLKPCKAVLESCDEADKPRLLELSRALLALDDQLVSPLQNGQSHDGGDHADLDVAHGWQPVPTIVLAPAVETMPLRAPSPCSSTKAKARATQVQSLGPFTTRRARPRMDPSPRSGPLRASGWDAGKVRFKEHGPDSSAGRGRHSVLLGPGDKAKQSSSSVELRYTRAISLRWQWRMLYDSLNWRPKLDGKQLLRCMGIDIVKVHMCVPYDTLQEQSREDRLRIAQLGHGSSGMRQTTRGNSMRQMLRGSKGTQKTMRESKGTKQMMRGNKSMTETVIDGDEAGDDIPEDGRTHLLLDRTLGTAMIHAHLSNISLMRLDKLRDQAVMMELLPWEMPRGRSFSWYVKVFMVILEQVKGAGWLRRARKLQLVLLQVVDGHFEMTQALANLLRVGEPLEPMLINPNPKYDLEVLRETVPTELRDLLNRGQIAKDPDTVWATMLGVALYDLYEGVLLAEWVINPEAPPSQRQTLDQHAQMWVDNLFREYPLHMRSAVADIAEGAMRLVEVRWAALLATLSSLEGAIRCKEFRERGVAREGIAAHGPDWQWPGDWVGAESDESEAQCQKRVVALQEAVKLAEERKSRRKTLGARIRCSLKKAVPVNDRSWRGLGRWLVRTSKAGAKEVMNAHPLLALWSTSFSAQLTRAKRVILQVNNFFMMLSIVVWFTYSRSTECCRQHKAHVGCPVTEGDPYGPCLGFPSCGALKEVPSLMLPDELPIFSECHAFPEKTLLGRVGAVFVIVMILLPINAILNALFIISSSTPVPNHWQPLPRKQRQKDWKGVIQQFAVTAVHAVATMVYALFVEMQYFNKAMALMIMGLAVAVLNTNAKVAQLLRSIYKTARKTKNAALQFMGCWDWKADEAEDQLASMYVVVDSVVEKLGYALIFLFWILLVWVLITFMATLRDIIGEDAADAILHEWLWGLIIENFGIAMPRLVFFKVASNYLGRKLTAILTRGGATQKELDQWYEQRLLKYYIQLDPTSLPDDDEEEEGDAGEGHDDNVEVEDNGGADINV
ncbi:hypothetical protein CYMTET_14247 [Cymbomonas tetramitiformis]|uniref:PKD/REJ-like domain-containing protein n=1 Tax=Cymbomonas tetramitiformis TaxID=36881 RepID=A0AAE0GGR8_9CHLO|nr:hypothetical protein CYMTET_14247 [Cymbomonas tetramitiformis]